MIAQVGDRLIVRGKHVGAKVKAGVITKVSHPDGSPPYEVRWDDGNAGLIFPGPEASVESGSAT